MVIWPGVNKPTVFNWLMVLVVRNHMEQGVTNLDGIRFYFIRCLFFIHLSLSSGDL